MHFDLVARLWLCAGWHTQWQALPCKQRLSPAAVTAGLIDTRAIFVFTPAPPSSGAVYSVHFACSGRGLALAVIGLALISLAVIGLALISLAVIGRVTRVLSIAAVLVVRLPSAIPPSSRSSKSSESSLPQLRLRATGAGHPSPSGNKHASKRLTSRPPASSHLIVEVHDGHS